MFRKEKNTLMNVTLVMITLLIVFYVLYIWASLIIPFIIALLFSFAIIWLSNFFKLFKLPAFISFILSLITYILLFWGIWKMLWSNLDDFIQLLPSYQERVSMIITQFFDFTHLPEPKNLEEILNKIDLQYVFTLVVWGFTSIFSSAGIILFYVLFILLEYRYFKEKLNLMIWHNSNKSEIIWIIDKIKKDIKSYFLIKTVVSFITASTSYIVMLLFWLNFAVFWGLLILILNFIPSIGSIIAVWLVVIFSFVQPEFGFYNSVILSSTLIWIQVLMWNIIEPKFMGNKLNLSPLVIILSLWFWGSIWGIVGMLLSVPLMVIINIILWKIPATKPLAILLSEKWELQVDWWDEVIQTRKRVIKIIKNKFLKK
jgi:predicted PurR-regulated permease PerM